MLLRTYGSTKITKFPDEGRIHNLERMRPYVVFTAPTQTIALYHISSVRFNWRWKSNCVCKQGELKSIIKCSSLSKLFAICCCCCCCLTSDERFSFCLVWFQFLTNTRQTLCTFVWLKVRKSGQQNVQLVLQHCCKNELKSDVGRFTTLESNLSCNNRLLQKVERVSTSCNKICTCCAFYRPRQTCATSD